MKFFNSAVSFIVLSFFLLARPAFAESPVSQYLPKSDTVTGTIMTISMSKEETENAQKLVAKFQKAVEEDPEWFLDYAKKAPQGEPMPYNPKMGLTEDEYKQILSMSEKMKLVEGKKIKVTFNKQDDNSIKISTDPDSPINNLVIGDKQAGVKTPYGQLQTFTEIHQTQAKSPTGPWDGVEWKMEKTDNEDFAKSIRFAMGRLANKATNIIFYDVLDVDGQHRDQFDFIVFFPTK
jgi:hypothetical protein